MSLSNKVSINFNLNSVKLGYLGLDCILQVLQVKNILDLLTFRNVPLKWMKVCRMVLPKSLDKYLYIKQRSIQEESAHEHGLNNILPYPPTFIFQME